MSDFKSTLYGYYQYMADEDGLFKNLTLPTGIDKDTAIEVILLECGEMCPLWTDPYFMQDVIGTWSTKWSKTFDKWLTAYNATYNPIHNYDRTESMSGWDHARNDGSDNTAVTNKRSAYDASTYQPHDQSEVYGTTGNTLDSSYDHTNHMYGNIGVTTTQQMLEAEYKIAEWNIYEAIKDIFIQDFLIMVY